MLGWSTDVGITSHGRVYEYHPLDNLLEHLGKVMVLN